MADMLSSITSDTKRVACTNSARSSFVPTRYSVISLLQQPRAAQHQRDGHLDARMHHTDMALIFIYIFRVLLRQGKQIAQPALHGGMQALTHNIVADERLRFLVRQHVVVKQRSPDWPRFD